jgi:hypothetical protein
LSLTKLIPIEYTRESSRSTTNVLSSRASSMVELKKAAQKERERVLLMCFNNLKNSFLKQWFEQFKVICGMEMYSFLEHEKKLEVILENKFLSQQILSFYRNSKFIQGLYSGFFKDNNKTLNDKIIAHKVV